MKSSPSISQLGHIFAKFFRRYHVILFTLTVVIGVSTAVFLLNGLISASNVDIPVETTRTTFNKETIDKINSFSAPGSGQDNFSLPAGRVNPFVE